MTRYQHPNPLDLMFFAADRAAWRLGLTNTNMQIVFELRGWLDVRRLRRAVSALQRMYPAAAARCEYSPVNSLPRWRLDRDPPDPRSAVSVHVVDPPNEQGLCAAIERLYATPIDVMRRPGVRFHVLRRRGHGDVLMARFAHALMDARGATFFLEDLDALYEGDVDPSSVQSAGDESRDDYARLLGGASIVDRIKQTLGAAGARQPSTPRAVHLTRPPIRRDRIGQLRCDVRRLSPEQSQQVRDNAMRVCGFGRFGDYLRACAIRAFHRTIRGVGDGSMYTTLNLVNNRKRRERTPVCRNLTSAIPLTVPAGVAEDIPATADRLRDQMLEQKSSDHGARQFAALSLLMRTPTVIAGAVINAGWTSPRERKGAGFFAPPSLPLGLMGPFTRPLPTFCGVELENYYGFATARPLPGFTIDVNSTQNRINICGGYYDGLAECKVMMGLLDKLIDGLLGA